MTRHHLCTRTRERRAFPSIPAATFTTCAGLLCAAGTLSAAPITDTIAQKHPGDVGIGTDPAVVFYEAFLEDSVAAVVARYNTVQGTERMALIPDRPPDSPSSHSMQFTAGVVGGVTATQVSLYKNFGAGYDDLYFRYYTKYVNGMPHHSGLWFGGYNAPLNYPYPRAGQLPAGDSHYSIALEPIYSFPNATMDFYNYWRGMHSWLDHPTGAVGDYYGNTILHYPQLLQEVGSWVCYEIHLKLNPNPETSTGAALELWRNDQLVQSFDDSGPPGFWIKDKFCANDATGPECLNFRPANPTFVLLDQRYRTTTDLKINYFWPQNYDDSGGSSVLLYADMVVAKERIGCTVKK
jgi:hypothetical protein